MKLCADRFRGVVTPATAARILDIADRHSLVSLKQVAGLGKLTIYLCTLARS